jgi:hypothetical protein
VQQALEPIDEVIDIAQWVPPSILLLPGPILVSKPGLVRVYRDLVASRTLSLEPPRTRKPILCE